LIAAQNSEIVAQIAREATLLLTDRGRQGNSRREFGQGVTALEPEARRLTAALAAIGISPTLVERCAPPRLRLAAWNARRRTRRWRRYLRPPETL
jgi:hypothetical protein